MKIGIICKISPLPDEGGEHVPHHDGHSHRLTLFLYNSPYFPDIRVVTHTSLWLAFKPSFQPSDWLQHYTRHYCLSLRPTTQTPFTSMSWCCVSKPFLYKNDMRRTTLIILSNTEKNSLCCCAMDCNCWHCSIFYHETKSSSPILIVYSVDWKKETCIPVFTLCSTTLLHRGRSLTAITMLFTGQHLEKCDGQCGECRQLECSYSPKQTVDSIRAVSRHFISVTKSSINMLC